MTVDSNTPTQSKGLLLPEIIAKADSIEAAPGVVGQVLALTAQPDFAMDKLVRLVRMDPAITAHVLRMCNSPYYGLRYKVASLDHAIAVLGINALVDVILSSGLLKVFSGQAQEGYLLKKGQLWRHSVATALVAQKLASRFTSINGSIIFTAALLHDVGKLALSKFVSDSFYEIESLIHEQHYSLVEAEKQVLGIDHAALGGIIVEKWAFPDDIISAIAYHHQPMQSPAPRTMTMIVALSNLLASAVEFGLEQADTHCDLSIGELLAELKMDNETEDSIYRQVLDWLRPASDMFNVLM